MDEKYIANAHLMMNRVILNEIQKLQDNDGRFIWQAALSDSLVQTIFGFPVICCAEVPNNTIIFGDFKMAYKIVDRKDIDIMRDPFTSKPFVKFYAIIKSRRRFNKFKCFKNCQSKSVIKIN